MRSKETAETDAKHHLGLAVDALQDADASEEVINSVEEAFQSFEGDEPEPETVTVGFGAPATISFEVDDPTDTDEVVETFCETVSEMSLYELDKMLNTEPETLAENIYFIDGEDGEPIAEW